MNLIVAVSSDWGIGRDGDLLFRVSEDLKRFRRLTLGKTIVMGHNTFKSLPGSKPLGGRRNIVLSRQAGLVIPGVTVCGSPEEVSDILARQPAEDIFIIGGEMIYRAFLGKCSLAYVTKIQANPPADAFMPNLDDLPEWVLAEESEEMMFEGGIYRYCLYRTAQTIPLHGSDISTPESVATKSVN